MDCDGVGVVRPVLESNEARLLSVPRSLSPLLLPLSPLVDPETDADSRPRLVLALDSAPDDPTSVEALVTLPLMDPTLPSNGKFVLLMLPVTSLKRIRPPAFALALGLSGGREEETGGCRALVGVVG